MNTKAIETIILFHFAFPLLLEITEIRVSTILLLFGTTTLLSICVLINKPHDQKFIPGIKYMMPTVLLQVIAGFMHMYLYLWRPTSVTMLVFLLNNRLLLMSNNNRFFGVHMGISNVCYMTNIAYPMMFSSWKLIPIRIFFICLLVVNCNMSILKKTNTRPSIPSNMDNLKLLAFVLLIYFSYNLNGVAHIFNYLGFSWNSWNIIGDWSFPDLLWWYRIPWSKLTYTSLFMLFMMMYLLFWKVVVQDINVL
eukprot:TRINITY_DN12429_c0_g1_i1.p1 TRINITY_DN12429_c0_g1~~TRINITY_DN12429_c0_g1_i1.p1  ORF type:complete len:251 (+),score=3.05 TRINITY_DN12429_c0_g1_i1:230-982(+)